MRRHVITPAVRETLIEACNRDSRQDCLGRLTVRIEHFRNVIAKPNAMEAERACLRAFRYRDLHRLR